MNIGLAHFSSISKALHIYSQRQRRDPERKKITKCMYKVMDAEASSIGREDAERGDMRIRKKINGWRGLLYFWRYIG